MEMISAPRTKQDFYKRWLAMEFGNRPKCWLTHEALQQSGYQGTFSVRSTIPGGQLFTRQQHASSSYPTHGVVFQESLPDHLLVVQASMGRGDGRGGGVWLEYCEDRNVHFRQAMNQSRFVSGLEAQLVLEKLVDASSLEDLYALTDRFPNAVIEFATFACPVGVLPNRRTLVFEVREY